MSAKHTPGPWKVRSYSHQPNAYAIDGANGEEMGSLSCWNDAGEEQAANARLIAAAPELLEALEAILDITPFAHDGPEEDIHKRAVAAIKAARGE